MAQLVAKQRVELGAGHSDSVRPEVTDTMHTLLETGTEKHNIQFVRKRDGRLVPFNQREIEDRIRQLCERNPPLTSVKVEKIVKMTLFGAYDKIKTEDLDELSTANAASLTTTDPEYGTLASRIAISNLHKMTPTKFSECTKIQYENKHPKKGTEAPLISEYYMKLIAEHADKYDAMIDHNRDFNIDYFGYKTLEKSYLKSVNGDICDRPQYMWMRVAIVLHETNFEKVKESYDGMSMGYFTHATPTLFNACTPLGQLSSCFLLCNQDDSIEGLFNTVKQCAHISKRAGGIGIAYQGVRASGSYICGTHGYSKGQIGFAKILNDTARTVDQGGNQRKGAFAIYTEPWHADIEAFLDMKKISGDENRRCRDLFPAMWIPDLFFKRVINNGNWTLFCPNEAPGLNLTWGEEFEKLYEKYENTPGLARGNIPARLLFKKMISTMIESGLYMLAKDACNSKSNHQNLGTIQCSNLCTEIIQYSDPEKISVCTLASLALPRFVVNKTFDHDGFYNYVRIVTRNLDIVIDKNNYPPTGEDNPNIIIPPCNTLEEYKQVMEDIQKNPNKYIRYNNRAEKSSFEERSIGLGVQGEADVFMMMGIAFDSPEAKKLNKEIFETMYYAALSESVQLAKEKGHYLTYPGSPISKGIYQFDMWGVKPSDRWDWKTLEKERQKYGIRNSLLIAPMPTKSTSHILGWNECFEPYHSMIFKARVLSGEFELVNKHLITELKNRGLWNKEMRDKILAKRGSVQDVEGFPEDLKPIFKTVWEIKMRDVIDMAADRGPFIDQSNSMNLWLLNPDMDKIHSMILYGWRKGLKTLCYYLHIKSASDTFSFTVNPELLMNQIIESKKKEQDEKNLEDRYKVTTTREKDSFLNESIDPIAPDDDSNVSEDIRKRKSDEEEDVINTCPYDPSNPLKKIFLAMSESNIQKFNKFLGKDPKPSPIGSGAFGCVLKSGDSTYKLVLQQSKELDSYGNGDIDYGLEVRDDDEEKAVKELEELLGEDPFLIPIIDYYKTPITLDSIEKLEKIISEDTECTQLQNILKNDNLPKKIKNAIEDTKDSDYKITSENTQAFYILFQLKYTNAGSLYKYVKNRRYIDGNTANLIAFQMLYGLWVIQKQKVFLHNDIKLANYLVNIPEQDEIIELNSFKNSSMVLRLIAAPNPTSSAVENYISEIAKNLPNQKGGSYETLLTKDEFKLFRDAMQKVFGNNWKDELKKYYNESGSRFGSTKLDLRVKNAMDEELGSTIGNPHIYLSDFGTVSLEVNAYPNNTGFLSIWNRGTRNFINPLAFFMIKKDDKDTTIPPRIADSDNYSLALSIFHMSAYGTDLGNSETKNWIDDFNKANKSLDKLAKSFVDDFYKDKSQTTLWDEKAKEDLIEFTKSAMLLCSLMDAIGKDFLPPINNDIAVKVEMDEKDKVLKVDKVEKAKPGYFYNLFQKNIEVIKNAVDTALGKKNIYSILAKNVREKLGNENWDNLLTLLDWYPSVKEVGKEIWDYGEKLGKVVNLWNTPNKIEKIGLNYLTESRSISSIMNETTEVATSITPAVPITTAVSITPAVPITTEIPTPQTNVATIKPTIKGSKNLEQLLIYRQEEFEKEIQTKLTIQFTYEPKSQVVGIPKFFAKKR